MSSIRLRDFGDRVRATYWYLPTLMTVAACVSALILYKVDQAIPSSLLQDAWYIFQPQSIADAHELLTNIANVSLGIIGVVFSIILVPLSIAATQYGSIVLRAFLRDRGTQCVLGSHTATTFYCLVLSIILRAATIQTGIQLSVTVAVYMLIISLLLLLYFFHHVADSLQAASVIKHVSDELEVIQQEYSSKSPTVSDPRRSEADELRQTLLREGRFVASKEEGYVRAIDYNKLAQAASERNAVLYLKCLPGDFVARGDPLLLFSPPSPNQQLISTVARSYMLGKMRTLFQDTEYGIILITIIAVRALSPAINDPYTPVLCLDRLGAALSMIAERATPTSYYCDKSNQIRVIGEPIRYERLVDTALNPIREYGSGNAEVLIKMLETIKTVAAHTNSDTQRQALLKHTRLIEGDRRIGLHSDYDKQRVQDAYEETLRAINHT